MGLGARVTEALLEDEPFWSGFSPMPRSMKSRPGMPAVMSDMGGTPCTGTAAPGGIEARRRKSMPAW